MKSPVSGKDMELKTETRQIFYKGENIKILFHYYFCKDSGQNFTTTELDEKNLNQIQGFSTFNKPLDSLVSGY